MHIADGVDAGVAHRRFDRLHRLGDLGVPPDLLWQKIAGMGDANAEALLARALVGAFGGPAAREYRHVRRQHSLRAARHDECDTAFDRARSELEMRRERVAQCGDSVFAGEVVHPAVAFGLAQDREN